ncbi:NAD(P)-dependent alcohol dehydrogenase [Rhodococcoides fascians]|uniref:NAD(P)-dependent alcohol dehydrogenase n=1 Tax=Rhodococcoides fascians TaxID=1828 RepID=UPI00055CF3E4|nr:NAD(P)-dependent alcohol dehydrogenase [Rhodococcus fascians]
MRITAAVVREPETPFQIEELDLDAPRPGEVRVRVHSVGICHTDIGVQRQWLPVPLPLVLGHEGSGEIDAVGDGVTRFAVGDKVVVTFDACGICITCRQGLPAYCIEFTMRNVSGGRLDGTNAISTISGDRVNGNFFAQSTFASYAVANERNIVKVPEDVDLSLLGPLGCGIQTGAGTVMNKLRPQAGSSLVVFGVGAVGLSAVMAARVVGCESVIAVDLVDERLDVAREVGATHTLRGDADALVDTIREITGTGADFAVDTTASTAVVRTAVSALAPAGTCAVLGFGKAGTEVRVDMLELLMAGKTIVGVTEGNSRPHEFIPRLIELYRQGRFPIDRLVKKYSFQEINQAVEDLETGVAIKPVLVF